MTNQTAKIGVPAWVPAAKMPKRFTLTDTIKARKTAKLAARFGNQGFTSRMKLAKANKATNAAFALN